MQKHCAEVDAPFGMWDAVAAAAKTSPLGSLLTGRSDFTVSRNMYPAYRGSKIRLCGFTGVLRVWNPCRTKLSTKESSLL